MGLGHPREEPWFCGNIPISFLIIWAGNSIPFQPMAATVLDFCLEFGVYVEVR